MCAEVGVAAPQVALAVPVVLTVSVEAATAFAPARPVPSATTIVTVTGPPPLAGLGAAVMLVMLTEAGLTELTAKLLVVGHWLHWSGFATVPFTETNIVPFVVGLADGVTVQSKVRFAVLEMLRPVRSELLVHPAGTVRAAPTLLQFPPVTLKTR